MAVVLIGGREPGVVVIADYDESWPRRFEAERERLAARLSGVACRIEHVGSTAVPGLAAKPIVDVLVTVDDAEDDALFASALEALGYVLRVREPHHRMFRLPDRTVQVHVWDDGDPEVTAYLSFRDALRGSLQLREAYARLKRELTEREWADINDYADAKSPFITSVLARPSAIDG